MRSKRSVGEKLLSWPDLVLLVFFVAFLALALAGSLSPADGTSTVGAAFMPPSAEHPLGTDGLGRDVLARLMHGGAHLIAVAAVSTAVAAAVGVALGFAVSTKGRFARRVVVPARSAAGHSFDTRGHGSCVRAWFGSGDDDRGDHGGVGTLYSPVHALARPSRGRIALCGGGASFRRFGGEDGCARGASELGGSLGDHGGHEVHQLRLSRCDGRFSRVRPPRNGLRLGNHDTDGRHGHQPEPVGRACSHYRDCLHHHIGQSSA